MTVALRPAPSTYRISETIASQSCCKKRDRNDDFRSLIKEDVSVALEKVLANLSLVLLHQVFIDSPGHVFFGHVIEVLPENT